MTKAGPESAFAAYQEAMGAYVKQGTELPPGGLATFAPRSAVMVKLRPWSWRSMTMWPTRLIMQRIADRADAITLQNYLVAESRTH